MQILGFSINRISEGGDSSLEIRTKPVTLSAEVIWEYEQQLTLLAREHGFEPDGWGFNGVPSADGYPKV
ncbi:hypothetical protein [Planktotalea sp.]|uniref:hypothetical protein n=1 Tax=Planktotalea sp. TaxID=2029877 RepID=UPI0034503236